MSGRVDPDEVQDTYHVWKGGPTVRLGSAPLAPLSGKTLTKDLTKSFLRAPLWT